MRQKRPLLLLVAIGVLVFYYITNREHQVYVLKKSFADLVYIKERNMMGFVKMSKALADAGLWADMEDRLKDARNSSFFDFYIVQYHGKPLFFGSDDGKLGALETDFKILDRLFTNPTASYYSTALDQDHVLTIGFKKDVQAYVDRNMKEFEWFLIEESAYVLVIVLGVLIWSLRDLLAIARKLRGGGVKNLKDIKTRSLESETFLRGLEGYAQAVSDLSAKNEALGKQVLPSLKKEILSGKKPPYDFSGTMVRTDINNFSQIYNTYDVDTFMKTINEFFTELSHVVSRYNGLIHEFVGDEVIFYFKDEDHANSFVIAMSALRDINSIATRFHKRTMKDHGYPFTVKSSLAHGSVRFGPLVNGYSIASASLIETVRILSHVTEKDGNVIYFDGGHLGRIVSYCGYEEATRVRLKGYTGERTLYRYTGHTPLAEVLDGLDEANVGQLSFYRSDQDLVTILSFLRAKMTKLPEAVILKAIHEIKAALVTKSDGSPTMVLCDWLDEMAETAGTQASGREWKVLSSASMLAMNLVPQDQFNTGIEKHLSRLLKIDDKRVVANALEVMTYFKSEGDPEFLQSLVMHENNRIAANALVHEGSRELSPLVIKRIRKMIDSGKPGNIASAYFAVGELAAHHKATDVVYYSTQVNFLRFLQKVPEFAVHEDPMVRRQALTAARKAGDEQVITRVWEAVRTESSGQALRDAVQILGSQAAANVIPLKSAA